MKKFLVIISILLISLSVESFGQSKKFAIEFGGGVNYGLASFGKETFNGNMTGADLFLELRYRIKQSPFEVGLHVGQNILLRESLAGNSFDFMSTNYMIVGNYNHKINDKITLFGGVGLGVCNLENSYNIKRVGADFLSESYSESGGTPGILACMPRIGIQVWKLRLTTGYKFQEKANRHAFTTLSFCFNL